MNRPRLPLPHTRPLLRAVGTALAATLTLTALRAWALQEALAPRQPPDAWRLGLGEASFWGLLGLGAALLHTLLHPRIRPAAAVGVCLLAWAAFVLSAADIGYFAVTGTRADAESLRVALRDLPELWPVVQSEIRGAHLAGLFGFALAVAALRWAPLPDPRSPALRLGLIGACAAPAVGLAVHGHPALSRPYRPLRDPLVQHLWTAFAEEAADQLHTPDPLTLTPVQLRLRDPARPLPNIVLVILESTGAHHTTPGARPGQPPLTETPVLARLALEGLWAPHHTTITPHTSKALVATLCGTEPLLRASADDSGPGGVPPDCLPALLRSLGYRTAFFQTADDRFEDRAGLTYGMGFETFRGRDAIPQAGYPKVNYFGWDEDAMRGPGMAWATAVPDQPFFQTYLTLSGYHDYGLPRGATRSPVGPDQDPRAVQHADAVRAVDAFLGRLIDDHARAGLLDNTLFIVQGDHGEAFGEHGRKQHDLVIWEEGLRIPLVLWGAPLQGRQGILSGPRSATDILPTVLDLIGATPTGGRPLSPSLLSPVPADRRLLHACWRTRGCAAERTGARKIIDPADQRPVVAHDLEADPTERRPRALPGPEAAAARARLAAWRATVNGRWEARRAAHLAARTHATDPRPALARLGDRLDALGCERSSAAQAVPGEVVWVRCTYRVAAPLAESWRARTQAGEAPPEPAALPFGGASPTFQWPVGAAVTVDHRVRVPADAPAGPLALRVAWVRADGAPVADPDGFFQAPAATVEVLRADARAARRARPSTPPAPPDPA